MATVTVRYRDPKTGRFVKLTPERPTTPELYGPVGEGRAGIRRVESGSTRRHKAVPRELDKRVRKLKVSFQETTKGRTLHDVISKSSALRKLKGKDRLKLTVEFKGIGGQKLKFTKTVKLAKRGKRKAATNRAAIISAVLQQLHRFGFRASPKKARVGAMRRMPTARNIKIRFEGIREI